MADASRCPECRARVHPYAAGCPSCGADLDAYRRQRAKSPLQRARLQVPSVRIDLFDLVVPTVVMLLVALFAPLVGVVLALFIMWHSHHNGLVWRRNVACACAALALVNLLVPSFIEPHLI